MMLCIVTIFSSCKKDDDDGVKATVNITVKSYGRPQVGVLVYMFDALTTNNTSGYDIDKAKKYIATNSNGVATFELDESNLGVNGSQTTFRFVAYSPNSSSDYMQVVITIKDGETKSELFDFSGETSSNSGSEIVSTKGTLNMSNNSGVEYLIMLDGKQIGSLESGKTKTLDNLSMNEEHVIDIYELDKSTNLYTSQTKATWTLTFTKEKDTYSISFPKVSIVSIKHSSSSPYKVYIDGLEMDTWTKSGTYNYHVSAGQHVIEVVQQDGYLLSPTIGKKTVIVKEGETITLSGPQSNTSTDYFN